MNDEQNEAWREDFRSPAKEEEVVCLLRIPIELADIFEEIGQLLGTRADIIANIHIAVMLAAAKYQLDIVRKEKR